MNPCLSSLFKRTVVINAIRISLVVGTVLNLINQGPALMDGAAIHWGKFFMNFLVPYCVASYSAAKNEMEHKVPGD